MSYMQFNTLSKFKTNRTISWFKGRNCSYSKKCAGIFLLVLYELSTCRSILLLYFLFLSNSWMCCQISSHTGFEDSLQHSSQITECIRSFLGFGMLILLHQHITSYKVSHSNIGFCFGGFGDSICSWPCDSFSTCNNTGNIEYHLLYQG